MYSLEYIMCCLENIMCCLQNECSTSTDFCLLSVLVLFPSVCVASPSDKRMVVLGATHHHIHFIHELCRRCQSESYTELL